MQSPREVVDNLLRRKKADRIGLMEYIWFDTQNKWLEQGYPKTAEGKAVDPTDHFQYDMASVGGWFDVMPLRNVNEVVEETDEWVVRRNGAGAALKWWKNKSGTPEHVDFRMTSREIWEKDYRPLFNVSDFERASGPRLRV